MKKTQIFIPLLTVFTVAVQANDTVLRILCAPQDSGATIYVNGSVKGECSESPLDVFISAGPTTVEAKRMPDPEHEQMFTERFTAIAGVAKRVKVVLSAPQLTQAALQARKRAAFEATLKSAENGDMAAMAKVAELYDAGTGVRRDAGQAQLWRDKIEAVLASQDLKAAESGDLDAMAKIAERYKQGKGVARDQAKATAWMDQYEKGKEAERQRLAAEQRRQAAARRQADKAAALERASYTKYFDQAVADMARERDPFAGLSSATLSPLALIFDLTSLPTRWMERREIQKKYAAHPAAWAKPASMLARAYHADPVASVGTFAAR
ncbi:hypothetical protein WCX49_01745 [Sulfurimonas sp. HSL-1656]|uniref:hypothetical protein n=1 Tax=Thiomicrolovo subterrani TaxID=3131934 RepID=UPI0031F9CEC3